MIQPDPQLAGRFYNHTTFVNESQGEGEDAKEVAVPREVIFCEIMAKGQTNSSFSHNLMDEKKLEEFKERFPQGWRAFEDSGEAAIDGTPLKYLAGSTPGFIAELALKQIRSIEDLAQLQDSACMEIREGYKYRKAARAYFAALAALGEEDADFEGKEVVEEMPTENLTLPPKKQGKKKGK